MAMELPEHLRTGPMADAAKRALADAQAMSAASNSIPRLSFGGREFKLVENGETVARFKDVLDVVILGVEPGPGRMIKTFYKGAYQPGAKEPPDCASDDGLAPSAWVVDKQNPTCPDCRWNKFGSKTSNTGKPTKACRDSKRIWFKLAEGNRLPGKPGELGPIFDPGPFKDRTLFGANITVASLNSFAEHGRELQALGVAPAVCISRMVMQEGDFPYVSFEIKGWLDAETVPLSLELAEKRPWKVYAAAGVALAAPDSGPKVSLPAGRPPVPDHIKQQMAAGPTTGGPDNNVVEMPATPTPEKPASDKDIDDAVGTW